MPAATDGLNKAQQEAARHDRGPLMVLAGPGTGKTRVIAHRIAHMVRERSIAPETVVAVTYTVKAAQQLRDRLIDLVGPDADGVHVHTFHGLGLRIIRRFADEADVRISRMDDGRGGIIDSAQTTRLLRSIVVENKLFAHARAGGMDAVIAQIDRIRSALADAGLSCDQALKFAAEAEARLKEGLDHAGKPLDQDALAAEVERIRSLDQAARAIAIFETECRERGWLTFGDLISLPIKILRKSGRAAAILRDEWRHLVVDEFQDVNAAQIELLRLLAPPKPGAQGPDLCVVGDDDQSIYEFRGADDRAFQRFSQTWPGHATVKLSENYRSGPPIVGIANSVLARATSRYAPDKEIDAARTSKDGEAPPPPVECVHLEEDFQDGEAIAAMILTDRAERRDAKWSDYAVVVRNHIDAERIQNALRIEGVPTIAARDGTPSDDEGVKDILAWIELLGAPHASHAAARILTRPPFSINLHEFLPATARYRAELSRFEAGEPETQNPGSFADWLTGAMPGDPAASRFAALHADLRRFAAESSAPDVIYRIVIATDSAHADLLPARERAMRVSNLVALIKFARERQVRLEPPGDIRAFWSYYQDLSGDEQKMRDANLGSRVDGVGEAPGEDGADAVRLLTAHSAKGLEFDTVFVPRVTPNHGYGSVGREDEPVLPAGLIQRGDDRTPRQRAQAEQRRLFYVACTRAERRLVLLSRKNKGKSRSTHYFQEITLDASLGEWSRTVECADLLKLAGALGLGQAYGWSRPGASSLDGEAPGFKTVEHRKEVFEQARRELRVQAAGALDSAMSGNAEVARIAGETLRGAAQRLGALAIAESAGHVPTWADEDARAFARAVLEKAGRDPKADDPLAPTSGLKPIPAPLHLSYTQVKDYLDCPSCYYVKHVLGLPEVPRAAQVVGIAVHQALESFYLQQREQESVGGPLPTRERLIELGRSAFFQSWPRHLETDHAQLDQVQAQLGLAYDQLHDPRSSVVEVERNIHFSYGPHAFWCKIDRIDRFTSADGREAFRIVDYKTGRANDPLREPEADDLQLGIYALALEHLYGADGVLGVAEYWLLSSGERGVIDLDRIDRAKVRASIDRAIAGMLAGHWERGDKCRRICEILGTSVGSGPIPVPGQPAPPTPVVPARARKLGQPQLWGDQQV
jgi:DNA helicase-2/ATP-dependent DNA helicase PcrA